MEILGVT